MCFLKHNKIIAISRFHIIINVVVVVVVVIVVAVVLLLFMVTAPSNFMINVHKKIDECSMPANIP